MTNRELYKFDDFTLSNYRRLIQVAKAQGFHFILHKDGYVPERKDIIWRHDVEFSPAIALEMAKIEAKESVKATYFFQLHSHYYNTVERYFTDILKEIKSLGHHIGLHFDSHYFNIQSEDELNKYIELDKNYMNAVLGLDIDTFSFHNTNPFILSCKDYKYGGLINVYSSYFKENYDYCADSTGIWRYERLEEKLKDTSIQHLQVLTHDGMWSENVLSPRQRHHKCVLDEAKRINEQYDYLLPRGGNKNVDDDCINPNSDGFEQ